MIFYLYYFYNVPNIITINEITYNLFNQILILFIHYVTPLNLAIEKEYIEIVQLLLSCKNIDVNEKNV